MSAKHTKIITLFLTASIILATFAAAGCSKSQLIEIEPPQAASEDEISQIYIGGAVAVPGIYPLKEGDNLEVLIQAAGGTSQDADLSQLKLYIPRIGEVEGQQKIDINRAEVWLLEALPGICEVRAQTIVDYRSQNGPFSSTNELIRIAGIGAATYEQIKDLITVAD